ncbi:MAG TPA: FecR domain-containing protein, partial [Chlamydiales bacterium]|nr:FecR domain-containing protein [Chlamydiales bacterium]
MDTNKAREILQRYREGGSTSEEQELVEQWYKQLIETGEWQWGEEEKMQIQQSMESNLLKSINQDNVKPARIHPIHFRRLRWWAAAAILILISAGLYFMVFNKDSKKGEIVKTIPSAQDIKAPEISKAMITLADGRIVELDSFSKMSFDGVRVTKTADGIVYAPEEGPSTSQVLKYNTLTNPRGSKVIDLVLSDGSRVWLNAGTTLIYPVVFSGNERKVDIEGEAYFEIAKNPAKVFKVVSRGITTEVTGTHFNVNNYEDEDKIRVTLLEGSVSVYSTVTNGKSGFKLKPGEQAEAKSIIEVKKGIAVDQVMAWKNGKFEFGESTDLKTIMRQISRWYDVEVEYSGEINQQFGGSISREVSIKKVLEKFELTGKIKFILE